FGERVEDFQVEDRLSASAERNSLVNVAEAERDGVGQGLLHFFEGAEQRLLEAGAAILLECFLGHNQRHQFTFSDRKGGESVDVFGVMIALPAAIPFERQA